MGGFDFSWVAVGAGRLALWHRPRLRAIPYLRNAGCDRVATLLSEREGAAEIGSAVEAAGLAWIWIPLASGRRPEGRISRRAQLGLDQLTGCLDQGESVLMHCSAGMHRTGMMAYALLRLRGFDSGDALGLIEELRPLTRQALGPHHTAWGDESVSTLNRSPMTSIPADLHEPIARAIHERYRRNQRDRKPPADPSMNPWETLAETLKNSNRDQAIDIGMKLDAIGCRVAPASDGAAATFTSAELERLATLEHDRWVAERSRAGWTLGPVKDVELKRSPYLVPWEELAEEIREYDREAVRAIPEVLAEAGLVMARR